MKSDPAYSMTAEMLKMKLLDDFELAELLGVRPSWVAARGRRGEIPSIPLGRYRRYDPQSAEFRQWLDGLRRSRYDARQSKMDGPEKEKDTVARLTYQKGSVEKRSRKHGVVYVLRYRLRNNDKWSEKTEELRGCENQRQAMRHAAVRMAEINQYNNRDKRSVTVVEFVAGEWAAYVGRLKESTQSGYRSQITGHILPVIGDKLLREVTPSDITRLLDRSAQTRRTGLSLMLVYATVKQMMDIALQYDYIDFNPVRPKIHRPKETQNQKVALSGAEIVRVIESSEGEGRVMLLCLAVTGIRVGELGALKRKSIDFDKATMYICATLYGRRSQTPKTQSSYRTLRIPEPLLSGLRLHCESARWVGDDDYVFCDADGLPYRYDKLLSQVLEPAFKRAGIERAPYVHGFHLFRHSAATLLDEITDSLRPAQKLLGHTSEAMTADYTHQKKAVDVTELVAGKLVSCGLTVAESSEVIQ